ncbi:MAG: hypothetical protein LBS92_03575 [Candidatus Methanoplasma sp.]|nr:hypothetical protein [Candidatus Methanoplasma sp.]
MIPHNFCNIGCIPEYDEDLRETDPEIYLLRRPHGRNSASFIHETVKRLASSGTARYS